MNKRIIIGIALILVGLGVASIPFLMNARDEKQGDSILASIETGNLVIEVPAQDETVAEVDVWDFQSEAVKMTNATIAAPTPNPSKTKSIIGIGSIRIDKIDLTQPLVEGCGKTELQYAVGHLSHTAFPGQAGNCVLAGHRNYTYGKMFNRLEEIVVGDKIVITTADKITYTYEVYNTLVVEPGDSSILAGEEKDHRLTLITCTPVVVATHRFIVQANLIATEPAPKKS